jgi:hypothetical protein
MPRTKRLPIILTVVQRVRFLEHVAKTATCWLWTSRTDDFGYGHFKVKGRSLKAHRVAWTIERGPIPDDKTLDHICRNPRCVNPAHLALISNKENILRGVSPTALNARRTHCKNGHELGGNNLAVNHGRRECIQCRRARCRRLYAAHKAARDPHLAARGTDAGPRATDPPSSFVGDPPVRGQEKA